MKKEEAKPVQQELPFGEKPMSDWERWYLKTRTLFQELWDIVDGPEEEKGMKDNK